MTPQRLRLAQFAALATTIVLLVLGVFAGYIVLSTAIAHQTPMGTDLQTYQDRTSDWIAGRGFYLPRQLAGPYVIQGGDALYPPTTLLLFVPFTLWLPAIFWWAIPLSIIAAAIIRVRPAWWSWPVLAVVLLYPRTWILLMYGNPAMWMLAALAAGAAWGWPAPFAALKLAFAPLALISIRDRRWRLGLVVLVALSLPFGAMWIDYGHVLINAQNPFGIGYLIGELPIAIALVVALTKRPQLSAPLSRSSRFRVRRKTVGPGE